MRTVRLCGTAQQPHGAAVCDEQQQHDFFGYSTPQRTVQWMPVGPPATVEQLACEWPDFAEWNSNHHNQHHSHHNNANNMMMMNDDSGSSKRDASENDPTLWFATAASSETTAAQPPPAKRACRPTTEDHARFFNEQIGVHHATRPHRVRCAWTCSEEYKPTNTNTHEGRGVRVHKRNSHSNNTHKVRKIAHTRKRKGKRFSFFGSMREEG